MSREPWISSTWGCAQRLSGISRGLLRCGTCPAAGRVVTALSHARGSARRWLFQQLEHGGLGQLPAPGDHHPQPKHRSHRDRTTQPPTCAPDTSHTGSLVTSVPGTAPLQVFLDEEPALNGGLCNSFPTRDVAVSSFPNAGLIWGKPQTYKACSCDVTCCSQVAEQTCLFVHLLTLIPDVLDQIWAFYNFLVLISLLNN